MKKRTVLLLILLCAAAQLVLQALPCAIPLRMHDPEQLVRVSYYNQLASTNLFLPIVIVALSWLAHALLTLYLLTKRRALLQIAVIATGLNVVWNLVLSMMIFAVQTAPVFPLLIAIAQALEVWAMTRLHAAM